MIKQIDRTQLERLLANATALHGEGRLEEAVEVYRELIRLLPDFSAIYAPLAEALTGLERWDEAIATYRQAIALIPVAADLHLDLANVLRKRGKLSEAIAVCRQAIALAPTVPGLYLDLGEMLGASGNPDEAVAIYAQAIAFAPEIPHLHLALGKALRQLGRIGEAIDACCRATLVASNWSDAFQTLADLYESCGRFSDAASCCASICKLTPSDAAVPHRLGLLLLKAGDLGPAILALERSCSLDPNMPIAAADLARARQIDRMLDAEPAEAIGGLMALGYDRPLALAMTIERSLLRGEDAASATVFSTAEAEGIGGAVADVLVRSSLIRCFGQANWKALAKLAALIERRSVAGTLMRGVAQIHLGDVGAARDALRCASLILTPPDFSPFQAEDASLEWDTSVAPAQAYPSLYQDHWNNVAPLCPEISLWQVCATYLRATVDPRPNLIFSNMPYAGSSGVVPVLLDILKELGWYLSPYAQHDSSRFKLLVGRHEPFFQWTHTSTDQFMPFTRSPQFKFIYMHRDPRDCLNSLMNDPVHQCPDRDEFFLDTVKYWHECCLKDALRMIGDDSVHSVTFAQMKEDMGALVQSILDFAGIEAPADVIARAVRRHSFEAVTGRRRGEDGSMHRSGLMVRKGISGGWRQGLTPAQHEILREIIGDDLVALGYEMSRHW
jgi:tetratricopeptide (TPR) repeat protein